MAFQLLPEISDLSCRFCLTKCKSATLKLTLELREQYESLTGFKVSDADVPKKKTIEVESYLSKISIKQEQDLADLQLIRHSFDSETQSDLIDDTEGIYVKDDVKPDMQLGAGLVTNPSLIIENDEAVQLLVHPDPDPAKSLKKNSSLSKRNRGRPLSNKPKIRVKPNLKPYETLENPVRCSKCHKIFRSFLDRRNHQSWVHKDDKHFFCDLCENSLAYSDKSALSNHLLSRHVQEYPCQDCGKYFAPTRMKSHRRRYHNPEAKIVCQLCGKGFALNEQFKQHTLNYHTSEEDWRFQCKICKRKFKKNAALQRHISDMHTEVQTPENFSCMTCGKSFKNLRYLQLHLNVHKKAGYDCPVCLKQFSASNTLRPHILQHHPEIRLPPSGTILKNYNWSQAIS